MIRFASTVPVVLAIVLAACNFAYYPECNPTDRPCAAYCLAQQPIANGDPCPDNLVGLSCPGIGRSGVSCSCDCAQTHEWLCLYCPIPNDLSVPDLTKIDFGLISDGGAGD